MIYTTTNIHLDRAGRPSITSRHITPQCMSIMLGDEVDDRRVALYFDDSAVLRELAATCLAAADALEPPDEQDPGSPCAETEAAPAPQHAGARTTAT